MNSKPQRYALVGMKHRGTAQFVEELPPDEPLVLVREPDNKYDRNAIQVFARGRHVGYIAKEQNSVLAMFIDSTGKPHPVTRMAADNSLPTQIVVKSVVARLHRGSNTWPLVEIV